MDLSFCDYQPTVDTTPCDDGFSCTSDGLCDGAGLCVSTANHGDCVDADLCTIDTCDPLDPGSEPFTGCLNSVDTGAGCDDGNACTENDTCGASLIYDLIGTDTCDWTQALTFDAASPYDGFTSEMISWMHVYPPFSASIVSATLTLRHRRRRRRLAGAAG